MPLLLEASKPAPRIAYSWDYKQRGWDQVGVNCQCSSRWTDWDEFHKDVWLHQILRQLTPNHPRVFPPLQSRESIWKDGDHQPEGKINFFEKCVGKYSKSGIGIDPVDQSFALDASF